MKNALPALIVTRICHDLASPIGAISNVADMMRGMGDQGDAEDLDMLCRAAERGTSVLKFYRVVLGYKTAEDPGIMLESFIALSKCQEVANRLSVEVTCSAATLEPKLAKLSGLLLMAGASMAGLKGVLRLSILPSEEEVCVLDVVGDRVTLTETRAHLLTAEQEFAEKPGDIEFCLIRTTAALLSARVEIDRREGSIRLSACPQSSIKPSE
ncbi:MAG: hypothetical protein AAF503_07920 [Pseudomonadota bacterium]